MDHTYNNIISKKTIRTIQHVGSEKESQGHSFREKYDHLAVTLGLGSRLTNG
jgi:hypothetical protein